MKHPQEITDWLKSHKGFRTPVHAPGDFKTFATSKTAACWGNPSGGIKVGSYRLAVCQPSPRAKGDAAVMFYDYAIDAAN